MPSSLPALPAHARPAPLADLVPNLLLAAVPILRAEAAERWLHLDPLAPAARLVAEHPWFGRLVEIPLDQATALSRSLTLLGTILAIGCGFALYRLARALGLSRLAAAPAIAYEFAPGLPALGFERAGLALLALPLLLHAIAQTDFMIRSPIPRIAAAIALLAIVIRPDQVPACAIAAFLFAAALLCRAPGRVIPRLALRLLAGAALGLCLAFPFTALGLLAATPSELVARFTPPLAAGRSFEPLALVPTLPMRLGVLLPSLGLAATGFASARRGAAALPAALALALLAGLAAFLRDGPPSAAPVIPLATALLAAIALQMATDHPLRTGAAVLLTTAAVGVILLATGLPPRPLAAALALMLLPAVALALGRAASAGTLVVCTAAAWMIAV